MMIPDLSHAFISPVRPNWLPAGISADMLRLDALHAQVSGNKWFKLKYNIEAALAEGKNTIVTFGGAWSNHLAATAAACNLVGLRSIGLVRGDAHVALSATLELAQANGMQLQFLTRHDYREAGTTDWGSRFPDAWVIPEGGHNALGVKGCAEILQSAPTWYYTHIICAGGTGTTLAGLINSAAGHHQVIGIPILKNAGWMEDAIRALLQPTAIAGWQLFTQYHGGGYAKTTPALFAFINDFYAQTGIPLDIIYTGKMAMAFRELAVDGHFPEGSRVLLIHTGGLQGNLSLPSGVLSFL